MKLLVSLCSAIVWGSGQIINKQYIKGLIFLFVQCIAIFVELSSGTWEVLTGQVDATFRNAGFFTKGIWGLVTLGDIPRERIDGAWTLIFDHSIMLMISGLIAVVLLFILILIWFWNIRDAYTTRVMIDHGQGLTSIESAKSIWTNSFEYIMITPGTILVVFISVLPVVFSLLLAFTNYNTNNIPPVNLVDWVGFRTFMDIAQIPLWRGTFINVLVWTVCWAFLATISAFSFGLLQAVLINARGIRFKAFWRGLFIIPWAIPGMVSILIFRVMFNREGVINQMLLDWGIVESFVPFLSNATWTRTVLVLINVWLGFPYFMALVSGVMTSISPELYEAIEIDGGNGWHRFRFISFPIILSAVSPLLVMSVSHNFNNFGIVYFFNEGGPANPNMHFAGSTDILITWIFKLTFDQRMYNFASAFSILIFIVVASVAAFTLMRTRAFKED